MGDAHYYLKQVRRDDAGRAAIFKISKQLEDRPTTSKERRRVIKDVRKGKTVRTAYRADGGCVDGERLTVHKGPTRRWLRTDGNDRTEDNLGEMVTY